MKEHSLLQESRDKQEEERVTLSKVHLTEQIYVSLITISRPSVRNALDIETMELLQSYVTKLQKDLSVNRLAVLLQGAGGNFISGGDLKALHEHTDEKVASKMSKLMRQTLLGLRRLPCLFITIAEGAIVGGGAEVFLSGDLRMMSAQGHLRFAQASLGLSTGWGGGRWLAQVVGKSKALEILLNGEKLEATRCQQLKLAHHLYPRGETLSSTITWLKGLSQTPSAIQGIKWMLEDDSYHEVEEREVKLFPKLWASKEHWRKVAQYKKKKQMKKETQISEQNIKESRGLFVVLEGIDGAGTTTQAERLVSWLEQQGRVAHFTQEPSEGTIGKLTRQALRGEPLGHENRLLPAESIALLFAADRADHWHNEIEPRLERGEDVICDRYLYSSLAYQGIELPEEWVRSLNQLFPQPDLLLFVEVDPEVASQRRGHRGLIADRYEVDELQVQIAKRYAKICKEYQAHWINGADSIDEVTTACIQPLLALLDMSSLPT